MAKAHAEAIQNRLTPKTAAAQCFVQPPLFHLTYIDMPHWHDLALVVVRFGGQAHGKGHRAYTAHEHDQHIQDLCPVVQLAGYAYGKAPVPKAEQDSKMASTTDTASEVL